MDAFGRIKANQGPTPSAVVGGPNAEGVAANGEHEPTTLEEYSWERDANTSQIFYQIRKRANWAGTKWHTVRHYVDGLSRSYKIVSLGSAISEPVALDVKYLTPELIQSASLPYFDKQGVQPLYATREYDTYSRIIRQTKPYRGKRGVNDTVTTFEYRNSKDVIQTQAAGSNEAQVKEMEFHYVNGKPVLAKMIVPSDRNAKTTYKHDRIGRLESVTDPIGVFTQFSYNSLNQKLDVTTADTGTKTLKYNTFGQLESVIDANRQRASYQYDDLNRVIGREMFNSGGALVKQISYAYDLGEPADNPFGHLSLAQVAENGNVTSTYEYGYDSYGNPSRQLGKFGPEKLGDYVTRIGYDPMGRRLLREFPDKSVERYDYNDQGRLAEQTIFASSNLEKLSASLQFQNHTPAGKPGSIVYGNGAVSATLLYNENEVVKSIKLESQPEANLLHCAI